VAEALCPWRGGDPLYAAIGAPDADYPGGDRALEGDKPGQDGDIKFYDSGELWYRPRFTDASARIRDRDHFAQMIAQHSIYAGRRP